MHATVEEITDHPRSWSESKKLFTVFGGIVASFTAVFGTSVYVASIPGIVKEFAVSETLAISLVSIYSLGQVIGPAITSASSELFGRRRVLQLSILTALIFTIGSASAQTFRSLAVLRFLASVAVSPCASFALGVINDVWDVESSTMGTAMVLIAAMASIVPAALGMVCGAPLVVATSDWRWTFWLTAIFLGVAFIAVIPMPESFGPQIARQKARRLKKDAPDRGDWKQLVWTLLARPVYMLFVEPVIFPTALVSAIAQGVVFCLYAAYPLILSTAYSFNLTQIGLSFLPMFVGNVLAIPILGLIDRLPFIRTHFSASNGVDSTLLPERRLSGAVLGGVMMPISLFWLGWTARRDIHWIVPLLSGLLFGMSYTLILISYAIYKNDIYGAKYGSSAFAAEVMIRYVLSAPVPLFTVQMIKRIGFNWSMSLVGFICVALVPIPWIFIYYGARLRRKSRFV
ncbi:MFS general substrate transporter [Fusarium austroafricanum]|uniref:MFS general substrate transporter n=1 Tax=Fusarium austroafricanum TaxID=2364996 RepID=A0A8H4JTD0_9HYPO|nr:MFS general substrate transporter [Fusarium austroafricanum]